MGRFLMSICQYFKSCIILLPDLSWIPASAGMTNARAGMTNTSFFI